MRRICVIYRPFIMLFLLSVYRFLFSSYVVNLYFVNACHDRLPTVNINCAVRLYKLRVSSVCESVYARCWGKGSQIVQTGYLSMWPCIHSLDYACTWDVYCTFSNHHQDSLIKIVVFAKCVASILIGCILRVSCAIALGINHALVARLWRILQHLILFLCQYTGNNS